MRFDTKRNGNMAQTNHQADLSRPPRATMYFALHWPK
jgi:hypothetical protein